jgi:hypothetical protein
VQWTLNFNLVSCFHSNNAASEATAEPVEFFQFSLRRREPGADKRDSLYSLLRNCGGAGFRREVPPYRFHFSATNSARHEQFAA